MCHTVATVFLWDQVVLAASPRMIRASAPIARKTSAVKVKGSAATALVNPTSTTTTLGRTTTSVNGLVYPNGRGSSTSNSNLANSLVYPNGTPSTSSNSSNHSSWLPILGIGAVAGIALLAMFGGNLFGGGSDKPAEWSSPSAPVDDPGDGGGAPPPPEPSPAAPVAADDPKPAVSPVAAPASDSDPHLMDDAKVAAGMTPSESTPGKQADRKLENDQQQPEQQTEKQVEKKVAKKNGAGLECETSLRGYQRNAVLQDRLASLMDGNHLLEGGQYQWKTFPNNPEDPKDVQIQVHQGQIQIAVYGNWVNVEQVCGNDNLAKLTLHFMGQLVQINITKKGNRLFTDTYANGELKKGGLEIGKLTTNVRKVASTTPSRGGVQ